MSHLADIRRLNSISINTICVRNLDAECVNFMLSDMFSLTPRMTISLAEVVCQKTGGNALFVTQFLESLYDEGLVWFSLSSKRWEWDICEIRGRAIADNVVELMTVKLIRMEPDVLDALKVAAALGAQCKKLVFQILDRAEDGRGIVPGLEKAVSEGIMNKIGLAYRFSHDQIQYAAYSLIPESGLKAFHLTIGRSFLAWASPKEVEENIFSLVIQLHRGSSLISNDEERVALARLSLMAGKMAIKMSAFLPASVYLGAGIEVLAIKDWDLHRSLCFDLYNLCSETEYTVGDYGGMKGHLEEVFKRGATLEEKLPAYYTLICSLGAQGQVNQAIDAGLAVIRDLGETLPLSVTTSEVNQELASTIDFISKQAGTCLHHLKLMKSVEKKQAMRFLRSILFYTFIERRSYFIFLACRMVRLSISHGLCTESAAAFASYGMVLCGLSRNFSGGYRYGKLALSIFEKFQAREQLPLIYSAVYANINPWREPIQSCLPPLKIAIDAGLATGNVQISMLVAYVYCTISLTCGKPLDTLLNDMEFYTKQMLEFKQFLVHAMCKPCYQAALNLAGKSPNPTRLVGAVMDEDRLLENDEKYSKAEAVLSYLYRMWLEYLFGEYELSWETRKKNEAMNTDVVRSLYPSLIVCALYGFLTAAALARAEASTEYFEVIEETMTQMEVWSMETEWNCQNKLELMKAEYAYLKQDIALAAKSYEKAIDLSAKYLFVHEEALAFERFGIFHLERGDHATACGLFERASECYLRWGAYAKAAHIQEIYL